MKRLRDFVHEVLLKKAKVQGLDNYSIKEIIDIVSQYIDDILIDADVQLDEYQLWLHGSRLRNTAREDSDLDVVMFYKGNNREDDLFNLLHDEDNQQYIENILVDINPVQIHNQGDIEQYKRKSKRYDDQFINESFVKKS